MNYRIFVVFSFFVYEVTSNFVSEIFGSNDGDCSKLFSFISKTNFGIAVDCCKEEGIQCNNEGFITSIGM